MCGNNCDSNIYYYYMYECLKLTPFPRRSQPAKFSCNKSCGGVFGEEKERTQWDFFLLFVFFDFSFCWIWPAGSITRRGGLLGSWAGRWLMKLVEAAQRRCGLCEDAPSRFISKQAKILLKKTNKVFKSMLEREKHCKNIFLRNVFFIRANILGCKC